MQVFALNQDYRVCAVTWLALWMVTKLEAPGWKVSTRSGIHVLICILHYMTVWLEVPCQQLVPCMKLLGCNF